LDGIPRGGSEVVIVARSARGVVLVVAWGWPGTRLVASPAWVVAVGEFGGRAGLVGVISQSVDRAGDAIEQLRGGFVAGA
jgi:hypothetical protein